MVSLWEKQSFLSSDVLIIGAGISGLSAAAYLKEQHPSLKVTVLERGILPTGASTKNAGFACFGSITELLNDIDTLGSDGMVALVQKRWEGLQKTRSRLGDETIDLQVNGGYELLFSRDHEATDQIIRINDLLHPLFKQEVFQLADEKIKTFGLGNTEHLVENKLEGQLDTGKMMATLWDYCTEKGVKIHTGCEVDSLEESPDGVIARCGNIHFSARKAGVFTNAFTRKLMKESLDLVPGRGIVMSVQPEQPLKLKGTYHYNEGYYYFRDYHGKLLFGGGRNLDLKGEETTDFAINEVIKEKLRTDLDTILLPYTRYTIEMEWTGIMAFGKTKAPIIQKTSENIAIGVRLGGMGVAIGSLVGEEVAKLIMP